jgi:hypothetical protein
MLWRPDQFEMHGLMRAFNDAEPAAHAFLIEDKGLHLLGVRHSIGSEIKEVSDGT